MPRRLQYLQAQSRKIQRIAVLHRDKFVVGLGPRPKPNLRAAAIAQLQMPGKKVSMEVGEEDIANRHAEPLGVGQILLDIPLRINDDRSLAGLVGDQIRGMGQTAQIVLFQEHTANLRTT